MPTQFLPVGRARVSKQVPGRLQVLHPGGLPPLGQKSGVPYNFPYHMDQNFAFSLSAVTPRLSRGRYRPASFLLPPGQCDGEGLVLKTSVSRSERRSPARAPGRGRGSRALGPKAAMGNWEKSIFNPPTVSRGPGENAAGLKLPEDDGVQPPKMHSPGEGRRGEPWAPTPRRGKAPPRQQQGGGVLPPVKTQGGSPQSAPPPGGVQRKACWSHKVMRRCRRGGGPGAGVLHGEGGGEAVCQQLVPHPQEKGRDSAPASSAALPQLQHGEIAALFPPGVNSECRRSRGGHGKRSGRDVHPAVLQGPTMGK